MTQADFLLARIASKIDTSGDCWLWTAGLNRNGYGRIMHPDTKRMVVAHRLVYEQMREPIAAGLQLDHLCRVRSCVNPAHLEPVTQRENLLRGETLTAIAAAVTHCPSGHPYVGDNLRISPKGHRYCRACRRAQESARRARGGEELRERQRAYDAASRARKRAA